MKTKKIAYLGLLTCVAMILSYLESFIPLMPGVPGIKIGLANMVVLLLIEQNQWKCGLMINIIRIMVCGFLFGSMFSIVYALVGGIGSCICMQLLHKSKCFTILGISATGGVVHNLLQLLVAFCILQSGYIWTYFPILVIAGILTGLLNGFIVKQIQKNSLFQMFPW